MLDDSDVTTAGTTAADGAVWIICNDITNAKKCNGGAFYNYTLGAKTGTIQYRIAA
jgi:hypothetical protein